MAEPDTIRTTLAEAVAGNPADDLEGAFLLGYMIVSEWMDADGQRWLTKLGATGHGETIPSWQERGYLNEALNHWPEDEPTEDE